ncbi:MBL fold metallo-hydrolase [Paractinoplanes ovalisporus]|uniref:MBL fold metallo-hydrolase n=1 Tax=Paractinoplanes ovalisporus TaxID=2810368 RepID=UPI001F26013E|nr:MBL fold metallo-hydrolase [Actinoplanes ovalisporus]
MALLVDTQFDLPMTESLQAAISAAHRGVSVTTVVNTHANGDHSWGNQLFGDAETISSQACAHGMRGEVQPAQLAALSGPQSPNSALGDYMRRHFGHFDFSGVRVTPPTRTFSGRLDVQVGERTVELIEVGPAHTSGDIIVHVPDAGVVYSGDILFVGDHPIVWTGPVENWLAACDLILGTGADRIVPGHGPVTDPAGVRGFRGYLELILEAATVFHAAGLPYWQAAARISLPDEFTAWGHRERLVISVAAIYANLGTPSEDILTVLRHTADQEGLTSRQQ